jgi:hypothetical protein
MTVSTVLETLRRRESGRRAAAHEQVEVGRLVAGIDRPA